MVPDEFTGLRNVEKVVLYPTKTYALDMENDRIKGYADGLAAMRQAVYKILMTDRFLHIIYSTNYGTELDKIMDGLYVYALVEQKIKLSGSFSRAYLWKGTSRLSRKGSLFP